MLTFTLGLLWLMLRQLFSWGGSMSDAARDKVRAAAVALNTVDSNGEPDFRAMQAKAFEALHRHGQVKTKKEILNNGRTRDWVFEAVIDDVVKGNAGLDDGSDEADEATDYLKDRVLWGGLASQSPTSVGQSLAVQNDLVLCETTENIDGHKVTLRFLSRAKDVVKDFYARRTIDALENSFKRTHRKLSKVALAVVPELEDDITKMLRTSIDTGLAALPEAKYEARPKKMVGSGNGSSAAITAAGSEESTV